MYFSPKFLVLSVVIFIISCTNMPKNIVLENGDLVFIGSTNSNLSKAIDQVTQTKNATNYTHIGIIEKKEDTVWVLHAASEVGSVKVLLSDFLQERTKDSSQIVVYRLKKDYQPSIKKALRFANANLGKPYNYTYILSDTAYYCSDFIYHSFEKDSVFKVVPMTFKNPNTNEFNTTWIQYYKQLGIEIPEGKLGCNPNGMAASTKLIRIGEIAN